MTQTQAEIFNDNRARGGVAVTLDVVEGRQRLRDVDERGSLRVRFPNAQSAAFEAVLVNTAGGIAGGDRFSIALDLKEDAQLSLTTAAAEKIYRSNGPDSIIDIDLKVAPGAALTWLPEETIVFDGAQLTRNVTIDVEEGGSLLLAEAIVFGRSAMGETVRAGKLFDCWRLHSGGKLVFAENVRLDGDIAARLARPAVGNGLAAMATVLVTPGDESMLSAIRERTYAGEVACSAWNGFALARLCAPDGAALRRDLAAVVSAFDTGTLPRLWLN